MNYVNSVFDSENSCALCEELRLPPLPVLGAELKRTHVAAHLEAESGLSRYASTGRFGNLAKPRAKMLACFPAVTAGSKTGHKLPFGSVPSDGVRADLQTAWTAAVRRECDAEANRAPVHLLSQQKQRECWPCRLCGDGFPRAAEARTLLLHCLLRHQSSSFLFCPLCAYSGVSFADVDGHLRAQHLGVEGEHFVQDFRLENRAELQALISDCFPALRITSEDERFEFN